MAGLGYLLYTAGQVLTAAQVNGYLMQQSNMLFATSAARDSALTSVKAEGMESYQLDSNSKTIYSGAAWSTIGPVHGALTSWTPTVTQSGSVTVTNNVSHWTRFGRWIFCYLSVSVTGSGTANNAVIIGGLPFTAAGSTLIVGQGELRDASAPIKHQVNFNLESTTTLSLRGASSATADVNMGVTLAPFSAALASPDYITGTFMYEAAADA